MTLLTAYPAFAQTGNSVLLGRVVDASNKAPVGDVVVTATSPALQGEQMVVTDGTGQYRVPNLPPGDYTLRFEKESYKPYARGGIGVRAATTIRVNVELLPEALKAEEIVVVGRAPTVDVGSSSVAQSITQDFTRRIAVSPPTGKGATTRSFESVAATTPGAQADEFGTSIAGTSSPENQYVIDGLSVNDPAYGIVGTPLTMEFIKEVNVVAGGYMPEFGRATGGVLDVVTKSGGNAFQGSVFFNITPGVFEGAPKNVRRQGETIQTDESLSSIRDYGFEVGGPILKDKLWFFAGADVAFKSYSMERNLFATRYDPTTLKPVPDPETGLNAVDRLPGTQRFYRAEEQTLQYLGKLTYQINPDHSVALSVYGSPSSSGGSGNFGFDPQRGITELSNIIGEYGAMAHEYVASSTDVALKWSSAFKNKTLLLDATLGWHGQRAGRLPPDGSELGTHDGLAGVPLVVWERFAPYRHSVGEFERLSPEAREMCKWKSRRTTDEEGNVIYESRNPCQVRQYWQGGPDYIDDASLNRFQLKAMVTSIFEGLGHHVVKAGIDGEITTYKHIKAYAGGTSYNEEGDWKASHDERQLGFLTGPDGLATGPGAKDYVIQDQITVESLGTTIGAFAQDSWSLLDRVTMNVGVRYDAQYLYANDGTLGLALANQWSPRVGVVYDITQQGRSKVFANYARYYESVPLDMLDRAFGDERNIRSYHQGGPGGCNPGDAVDATGYGEGQCRSDDNRVPITEGHDPNKNWITLGGGKSPVDPDLAPQSSDEIVIGGEYEVLPNGRVGATYTKRWMNNVIEDMSRDEANTYFIGNPGKGIAKDFPEATRDYDALTLYFNKTFSDLWLAQVSYTLSYLRGNYPGLFKPETDQLDPNINTEFDLASLLVNRDGVLPGDNTHEIKVYGAKAFELPKGMVLDLGLTYRSRSGAPIDYWGAHYLYGSDETFILPRGAGGRLPWVHNVDGHVGYSVKLAKDSELTVTMDVFNLFNFQEVVQVDQRYTTALVDPCVDGTKEDLNPSSGPTCLKDHNTGEPLDAKAVNPNFGKPTQFQTPRQFRFGARVTF
ncbi:TonB-dependent receptor [Sorangium sp. So ce1000]|uniref:TonB-dependent receptor n=1 Tax=Sorangium sp. So ce1000 TaxID=3133325 RepID=UPI003F632016